MYQRNTLPDKLKNRQGLKTIGFQRIEKYTNEQRLDNNLLASSVLNDVVDMDDPGVSQDIKDSIEFTVDMSDPKSHKLNVQLKPNKTRAAEQKTLRDQIMKDDKMLSNIDRIDKNVFLLYIDNISRVNFKRKLPKTTEWLSKFVDNKDSDYKLFQFFRHHSVYPYTNINSNALWYGQIGLIEDSSENVFDYFNRNGYVTGMFKDG